MNRFYKGSLLILLSAACYGVMPVFALYAYKGNVGVITLLFIRFTLAAMFFFIYAFTKYKKVEVTGSNLLYLFLLGGVCYTLQSTFYFSSVKYIPVSLAALLLYAFPIYVAIMSFFIDREKMTKQILASILISFSGLILVLGASLRALNILGILLAAGSGFVYSCYIMLANRVVKKLPPMTSSAFVTLFTAISLLVAGAFTGALRFDFEPKSWPPIMGIIVFSTIIPMLAFFRGLDMIGSTKASILSMFEPLVTIGFSALLLHERLTWLQALGGTAVLLGAVLVISVQGQNKNDVCKVDVN